MAVGPDASTWGLPDGGRGVGAAGGRGICSARNRGVGAAWECDPEVTGCRLAGLGVGVLGAGGLDVAGAGFVGVGVAVTFGPDVAGERGLAAAGAGDVGAVRDGGAAIGGDGAATTGGRGGRTRAAMSWLANASDAATAGVRGADVAGRGATGTDGACAAMDGTVAASRTPPMAVDSTGGATGAGEDAAAEPITMSSPAICTAGSAMAVAAGRTVGRDRRGAGVGRLACHTCEYTVTSSFSWTATSRHQERGSPRYRSCDSNNSGSFLFSNTGLVMSQVSTPGGSTYNQSRSWLKGTPASARIATYGTMMPAKTAIQLIGSGIGSRKSYSL